MYPWFPWVEQIEAIFINLSLYNQSVKVTWIFCIFRFGSLNLKSFLNFDNNGFYKIFEHWQVCWKTTKKSILPLLVNVFLTYLHTYSPEMVNSKLLLVFYTPFPFWPLKGHLVLPLVAIFNTFESTNALMRHIVTSYHVTESLQKSKEFWSLLQNKI